MPNTSTSSKKPTKKDRFNQLLAIAEVSANPELVDFINNEIKVLNKKNSRADKNKVAEKNSIVTEIRNVLATFTSPVTIATIKRNSPALQLLSSQKLAPILANMDGVVRIADKKDVLWVLAKSEESDEE